MWDIRVCSLTSFICVPKKVASWDHFPLSTTDSCFLDPLAAISSPLCKERNCFFSQMPLIHQCCFIFCNNIAIALVANFIGMLASKNVTIRIRWWKPLDGPTWQEILQTRIRFPKRIIFAYVRGDKKFLSFGLESLVGCGLGYLYILQICLDILDACNANKNLK